MKTEGDRCISYRHEQQVKWFSTIIPCSFESWLNVVGGNSMSEHGGSQQLKFASLGSASVSMTP